MNEINEKILLSENIKIEYEHSYEVRVIVNSDWKYLIKITSHCGYGKFRFDINKSADGLLRRFKSSGINFDFDCANKALSEAKLLVEEDVRTVSTCSTNTSRGDNE